jgi:hypothetical protein
MGVSGRTMLAALVSGTTDPDVLAEMAKTRLRARLPELPNPHRAVGAWVWPRVEADGVICVGRAAVGLLVSRGWGPTSRRSG